MLRPLALLLAGGLLLFGGADAMRAEAESVSWLRSYLRADTTNPPGHEERGVAVLTDVLRREGIPFRLLTSPSGRVNLMARLESKVAGARDLVLLHHVDVVAAGSGWTVPPFGGELRDGRIYGRGAIDSKGLGVAQLSAFVALSRAKTPLRRNVVFLAVADEETGGFEGARFLLSTYPELFGNVEAVLNEGGSNRAVGSRMFWWGIETTQKRALWLEVNARAAGGHAASLRPRSATHEIVQALARVTQLPLRYRLSPAVRAALLSQAPHHNPANRAALDNIDRWIDAEGALRSPVPPGSAGLLVDTLQVTVLDAGEQVNVIPAEARARIDIRLLPDTDREAFLARVDAALGPTVDYRVLLDSPPTAPSSITSPFFVQLRTRLQTTAPVTQYVASGVTDSRYFRERGIAAYGFSPFGLDGESSTGIHAADESIAVAAFERGVATYRDLVLDLATRTGQ